MKFKDRFDTVFPAMFPSHLPLITNELIAVQPMPLPTCHLFGLDEQFRRIAEEIAEAIDRQVLKDMLDFVGGLCDYPASNGVDRSRFPHGCPRCGGPAYIGLNDVDCAAGCR